ncbi:4'-phosphopantetheinyl transferase superfamily protein [Flavobacterium sp. LS1R49]|uniref:4'-phosphopantetheinyl transferase superfamily protein n=1 Tax=Flavobacterium shii TaxID=2987687 RepID=A0A9X2YV46_9FLAO|nr:4'-phosphopantetheinyl transferase superfamily protein [Flavobacterium shii]MCV9927844.1 4'-phosphopantetheinyl transferase superfamily protein [Flavobacterium shii]
MIYIYYSYISEDNFENLLENELSKFSSDYQDKIKGYRRWQDAQLSLLGRVILFKAIEQVYKCKLNYKEILQTKYNKPYFKDSLIQFNISHSGEIVVCALVEKSQVGIDIEIISDIQIDDFKWQMTEQEWLTITSSGKMMESFFAYWTQKEAVIKTHGHGLSIPLKTFEISEDAAIINDQKFFLKEIKIDEKYKCYISLDMPIDELCIRKI